MKPINCRTCGYLEKVSGDLLWPRHSETLIRDGDYSFCMKSYRMIDDIDRKAEDCPLEERPKDNADKKGFYLIKDDAG